MLYFTLRLPQPSGCCRNKGGLSVHQTTTNPPDEYYIEELPRPLVHTKMLRKILKLTTNHTHFCTNKHHPPNPTEDKPLSKPLTSHLHNSVPRFSHTETRHHPRVKSSSRHGEFLVHAPCRVCCSPPGCGTTT